MISTGRRRVYPRRMLVNLKPLKFSQEPTARARSEDATIERMRLEHVEDVDVELVVCRPTSQRWAEDRLRCLDSLTLV